MTNVVNFIRFKPVHYSVHLSHDESGFYVQVRDVSENDESRKRIAADLRRAAEMIEQPGVE